MSNTKKLTATAEVKVIEHKDHYAVFRIQSGTPAVLAGFTWINNLNGPAFVGSKARAKALADEKAKLGYCPSL